MNNEFSSLQQQWKNNQQHIAFSASSLNDLHKKIQQKERENYFFYYGTISTLSITLIVISLFFYYVAPVQESLSRIGAGLMITGLIFRIIIEIFSIYKAKRVNKSDSTLTATENLLIFHKFRKTIHQIVAPIVVILYTIGFYLITPEFSKHMPFWRIVLIDVSYVVIGIILFIVIRKGIKKEMVKLQEIIDLKDQITTSA
ncbi:hypothetical protein [Tenacibaculum amylolyticum]|uniref:hypothetical protein n=1 Tax=Tenacibaculum amylolyticum TaxID=104269 RepID=UPI0038938FC6